jgi:hypothetical protein
MKLIPKLTGWSAPGAWVSALVLALLWVSGMVLYVAEDWPLHPWAVAHGICAWLSVVLAGRYVWGHVVLCLSRWTSRWQWASGWSTLTCLSALVFSGWWLMYGPADSHDAVSLLHWALGAPLPLVLLAHLVRRVSRHAQARQPHSGLAPENLTTSRQR